MRAFHLFLALLISIAAVPVMAQEHDFNIWGAQVASVDLDEDKEWFLRAEAQERFTDDADRLGQLLLRSLIGHRINENVSIGAGYGYIFTDPAGPADVNEHRIYQEVTVGLFDNGLGTSITSRNRLEQRFFEESNAIGWRYRNQIQLKTPINENNKLVVYSEPFIGLNDVAFNGDGVTVWRNFIGVSVPIGEVLTMTPGYLNQHAFRNGQDRSQHIVNIGLSARF